MTRVRCEGDAQCVEAERVLLAIVRRRGVPSALMHRADVQLQALLDGTAKRALVRVEPGSG